jgi:hypothetical protein
VLAGFNHERVGLLANFTLKGLPEE